MRRSVARHAAVLALVCVAAASPGLADEGDASPAAAPAREASAATPGEGCGDAGGPACPTYARYVNDRFAFSVDIPMFLSKKGADADGRGQPFEYRANGKRIWVRAWCMYNAPVMTVDQLLGDWSRRGRNSYKGVAGNTWVVRGAENGQRFYMRSILSEGFITTIEATYDPSFEEELEPVLARMGATLMTWPGVGVRPKARLDRERDH
jgi:hypothetical protein